MGEEEKRAHFSVMSDLSCRQKQAPSERQGRKGKKVEMEQCAIT